MNTLTLVAIKTRNDGAFDIIEKATGYVVRGAVGTYAIAREIAERIDAKMIAERELGAGSLDQS